MSPRTPGFLLAVSAPLILLGCSKDPSKTERKSAEPSQPRGSQLPQIPLPPPVLPDDPKRAEKIDLGHHLFFDQRLSGHGDRSCYSCHQNEDGTGGHDPIAIGSGGKKLARHAPVIWNVAYDKTPLYWEPPAADVAAASSGRQSGRPSDKKIRPPNPRSSAAALLKELSNVHERWLAAKESFDILLPALSKAVSDAFASPALIVADPTIRNKLQSVVLDIALINDKLAHTPSDDGSEKELAKRYQEAADEWMAEWIRTYGSEGIHLAASLSPGSMRELALLDAAALHRVARLPPESLAKLEDLTAFNLQHLTHRVDFELLVANDTRAELSRITADTATDRAANQAAVTALDEPTIYTGDDYRWEVTAWPPPPALQLRVIDAIIPSVDQIREWAYDPCVSLAYQYKEFGLENPIYLELLIDLAADPKCAKREYILSILGTIIANFCPGGGSLMAHARDLAKATGESRLAEWASDLDRMLSYANGCGPVAHDEAQEIARIVLIGVRRPHLVLDESTVDGWWQFRARAPDGESLDCVYTHMATGNLFWARRVLAISELQPYEIATMRTIALGECFGGPTSV